MEQLERTLDCLEGLKADIENRQTKAGMSFNEFLLFVKADPRGTLRNIFQLFYDMVTSYVIEKEDEYPDDPESIGFVEFDCSKIFSADQENPFFPDRLFANRFVRQVKDFRRGSQQNSIHIYEGPPGCGKSTFLNNLLRAFQDYAAIKEGQSYEIFWQLDEAALCQNGEENPPDSRSKKLEIPCPSHDHPILIIPKKSRVAVLDKLLAGERAEERHKFSSDKEYEWLFEAEACTICQSLFWALCDRLGSLDKVLAMIRVRPYLFNRRVGEGISVFNPGDKPPKERHLSDEQIQGALDRIFGVNRIKYVFSPLARTNNGVYVLMDIKSHNKDRLIELHNVISEGVHKVNGVEERINSLFVALMNPEDKKALESMGVDSFLARIDYGRISYVMEVATEVKIYRSIFGRDIDGWFLPGVLENFARVIISSRMSRDCEPLQEWIPTLRPYSEKHFCDERGFLLRMEIYGGIIPPWLSEEDKRKFTAPIRRRLIADAMKEGGKGFCGRQSIKFFGECLNLYGPKPGDARFSLITMANVVDFFKHRISREVRDANIPHSFVDALVDWYDYAVLNQVKEALYFYNRKQIEEDVLHYLWAINYDVDGRKVKCEHTGKTIEVTVEFLRLVGSRIAGEQMNATRAVAFAQDAQKKLVEMLAREPGKKITETELYQGFFKAYASNLKNRVLDPFVDNKSFREAVKAFGNPAFETFDTRLKEHVAYMINNLVNKFGYTEQGAKEVCLYVLDQKLVEKFSQ